MILVTGATGFIGRTLVRQLSETGGGGYLILVSDKPIPDAVSVVARREHD
jgi:nucleoside-diphosphate-sugar epimerase